MSVPSPHRCFARSAALVALAATFAVAPALAQGDRQLLRTSAGNPYVFILFDSSASMNWAFTCSQEDFDAGKCDFLCETENCPVPRAGDDPSSKLYLAKKALYDVIHRLGSNINYGFGGLNQDTLAVGAKHWIYTVQSVEYNSATERAIPGEALVPAVGWQEVFGPIQGTDPPYDYRCDRLDPTTNSTASSAADYEVGCWPDATDAVDLDAADLDAWKLAKLQRLPKGGPVGQTSVTYYTRTGSGSGLQLWRVIYQAAGSPISYATTTQFTIRIDIDECRTYSTGNPKTCTAWQNIPGKIDVTYERSEDTSFLFWEHVLRKNNSATDLTKVAYFGGYPDSARPADDATDGVAWATDTYATETCRGWEPPGTTYTSVSSSAYPDVDAYDSVLYPGYNLRQPDSGYTVDLTGTTWEDYQSILLRGDLIPLDWNDDNRARVLERLSPAGNPQIDPTTHVPSNPGFLGQAYYFDDEYLDDEGILRLKNVAQRPLIGHGLTPLAGWFSFFNYWLRGCGKPGNPESCGADHGVGWEDIAAFYDPNYGCRKKYVLVITDGGETCDGSPQLNAENYYRNNEDKFPPGFESGGSTSDQCRYRQSLDVQAGFESLVLGLGAENTAKLQCANSPVTFVENYDELLETLEEFISLVREEAAGFASAAVPTVQANIADKIYLSSFTPLNDASVWPGRLDSFLKPLPVDEITGLPNRDLVCDPFDADVNQSECFVWDGGDSQAAWNGEADYQPRGLLLQAPLGSEITRFDNSTLQIGTGDDERRIFYGQPDNASSLGNRAYFVYPDDPAVGDATEQANYEYAWNLAITTPGTAASIASREQIAGIIEFTVKEKQAEVDNPLDVDDPFHIQYVMGDIFHSNPLVLNPPADFDYFTKDTYWNSELCGESLEDTRARGPQISYSWYSNKNLCRRVMIFVGSNDGQLHAFDGGVFEGDDCQLNLPANAPDRANNADDDGVEGEYNYGSGRELFSFIPQAMMPLVNELSGATSLTGQYGVDGTVRAADVFIDPVPIAGVPTCTEREWRTVLLGHYREGGPGIFALDITQPDTFDGANVPQPLGGDGTGYVPSCIEAPGAASLPADCDQLPFPTLKWEFRDLDVNGLPADDDGNGETDLAESWSRPLVTRLRVCEGACDTDAEPEDRFVAIFGGGLSESPANSASDVVGNWLYMIDIETGETLYKRGGSGGSLSPIVGSIAADITGLDFDVNGYIDTLYFGTTAGYVYKVPLGDGPFELDPSTGQISDPAGESGAYDPFQIFSTGGRPIYLEINAVYVPRLRANALLFGTGSRYDLWQFNGVAGRFYTILDQGWKDANRDGMIDTVCDGCPSPLTENEFKAIDPTDTVSATANYLFGDGLLTTQLKGWYFTLLDDEKLITEPFTLAGVTFFTVYSPILTETDEVCVLSGDSKIFVVNAVSSAGYAIAAGTTERTRYTIAPTFTTQPFVESSATKNAPTSSTSNADTWTDELKLINADLKKLFPPGARFANYTLDIKTIRSDTGIVFIAPVPVAIEPHNWKEF